MKIRSGFVSNSSSSSFLVPLSQFKSVFDIARAMIKIRNEDWKDWESIPDLFKVIDDLENNGIDPNTSVSFPTTNEYTWIVRTPSGYLIDTCNNHNWDIFDNWAEWIPDFNVPGYTEKDNHKLQDERVYFLQLNMFGKFIKDEKWYKTCQNTRTLGKWTGACNSRLIQRDDGSIICPVCEGLGHVW